MKVLFASNNVTDWGNLPSTTTVAGRFDGTRVPYAIELPDDTTIPMKANHPAPVGDSVWYHFHLYFPTDLGPAEDGKFADIFDGAGIRIASLDVYNGNMRAQAIGDTTVTGADYAMVATDAIIEIDVKVVVNGTGITCELYVGQALVSSATAANTGGKGVARRWDFALVDTLPTSSPAAFSEFLVSENDTRNARVARLNPVSAGAYAGWSGAISSLADDDDMSSVSSDTPGQRISATKDSFTGTGAIAAVVAVARAGAGTGGPQSLSQFLRSASVDYDGTANALPETFAFCVENWETDPATGAAWTAAGLNGAEIGLLSGA